MQLIFADPDLTHAFAILKPNQVAYPILVRRRKHLAAFFTLLTLLGLKGIIGSTSIAITGAQIPMPFLYFLHGWATLAAAVTYSLLFYCHSLNSDNELAIGSKTEPQSEGLEKEIVSERSPYIPWQILQFGYEFAFTTICFEAIVFWGIEMPWLGSTGVYKLLTWSQWLGLWLRHALPAILVTLEWFHSSISIELRRLPFYICITGVYAYLNREWSIR